MKKISTAAVKAKKNFAQPKLTIGLDLGDRPSWYCLLDEVREVLQEQKLGTTPKAMREVFGHKIKIFQGRKKTKAQTPSSGDCVNGLAHFHLIDGTRGRLTGGSTD